jgi:hypothetical protein
MFMRLSALSQNSTNQFPKKFPKFREVRAIRNQRDSQDAALWRRGLPPWTAIFGPDRPVPFPSRIGDAIRLNPGLATFPPAWATQGDF